MRRPNKKGAITVKDGIVKIEPKEEILKGGSDDAGGALDDNIPDSKPTEIMLLQRKIEELAAKIEKMSGSVIVPAEKPNPVEQHYCNCGVCGGKMAKK
jgi:hypothetical protein